MPLGLKMAAQRLHMVAIGFHMAAQRLPMGPHGCSEAALGGCMWLLRPMVSHDSVSVAEAVARAARVALTNFIFNLI